jgi:hypothetical protein
MCTEVVRVSHQKRKILRCPVKRCDCGHINHAHGPGGCSGDTLRGCCYVPCNCETFKLAADQTHNPKKITRAIYFKHQGPNGEAV